jgi:hypothetical protein
MLIMKERRAALRTIEGCDRALFVAQQDPLLGISSAQAVAAVYDVLDTIGETCPECPPK